MSIKAIDISSNNGDVNLRVAKQDGISVVFIKATEGVGYINPFFAKQWVEARTIGQERSAYHFFRPGQNPITQALFFLQTVKHMGLAPDDLYLMVDVEVSDGLSPIQIVKNLRLFCDTLLHNGEVNLFIYTDGGFWASLAPYAGYFSRFKLFIASWGHSVGALPRPWNSWAFWQFTDRADLPGFGIVDESLFYGTPANLEQCRRTHHAAVPAKQSTLMTRIYHALVKGGFGPKSARQVIAMIPSPRQHTP